MTILGLVFVYLIIINIVTFFAFGLDKRKAKKDKWRTPESTLVTLMVIGGALGGYFGMEKFRHKTQKTKFKVARIISFITLVIIIILAIKFGFGF